MKKNNLFSKYSGNHRVLMQIQQMLAICLIVLTLCISIPPQAQANNVNNINPNTSLDTFQDEPGANKAGKEAVTGLSKGINSTLGNVKEKLNLDEPLPESTKDFLANPLAKPKNQNPPEHPVGPNV